MVQTDPALVTQLARALVDARQRIRTCEECGALTETNPCAVCTDSGRDAGLLCVVERATDILVLEKAGTFRGRYHVLGGRLRPSMEWGRKTCAWGNWCDDWLAAR